MSYFLFPVPRKAVFNEKKHDYSCAEWIKMSPEFSRELKTAIIKFAKDIREFFPNEITVCAGTPGCGMILLDISQSDDLTNPQEYKITTSEDGIKLEGIDEQAIYFGLQTLSQIIPQSGIFVADFSIDDYPDFESRGYMLDVSRCKVPKLEELFHFIDMLSKLKYNELQLYMEHTFAFAEHEAVWYDSSPFTAEEILQIDQYCKDRFIELVPNFNSFGHLERWLKYDEYKHLAECPDHDIEKGERRGVLRPDETSLEFLDKLYGELLPNFSSKKFNVGCDETWELGMGVSKKNCEEKGKTQVYLDFLIKINELANKHGRQVMFWGDIILHNPELICKLPENITALNWGYEAEHPFEEETKAFAESGIPFYICPGTSSWNSLTGRTDNCMKNLLSATKFGAENGAKGLLMTDWGDNGHLQYSPISWPGICSGAAYSWCREVNKHADISEVIDLIVANDCGGVIGDYLLEYGNLYTIFKDKLPNATLYGKALLEELSGKPDWLESFSVDEVRKVLYKLIQLRGHLGSVISQSDDGKLIIEELLNSSYMTECALNKMLYMKGEEIDIQGLKELLRHVIRKHDELWLSRNRPGGLNESSGHLRKILDEISSI